MKAALVGRGKVLPRRSCDGRLRGTLHKETCMPSGHRLPRFARSAILPLMGGTTVVTALIAVAIAGCGSKKGTFENGTGPAAGQDGSTGDDGSNPSNNNPSGLNLGDASNGGTGTANSMCKGGFYEGQFGGLYSSHLMLLGFNIPVTGDVRLTLQQMGTGIKTCTVADETSSCSSFFSVENGTIDGVADNLFPYHCSLTGTLSCPKKKLVNGWINCTYS